MLQAAVCPAPNYRDVEIQLCNLAHQQLQILYPSLAIIQYAGPTVAA
jgi:hypothetical protein